MLVAHCQLPAAFGAARCHYRPPMPVGHAGKEAVFAAARNPLRLPGSFGHCAELTPTSVFFLYNPKNINASRSRAGRQKPNLL